MALLLSLFPGSAFGVQRYLKGCFSFYGQQLGIVFLPLITSFLGVYHWLISVAFAGVMRKLWIIFYSIVSLLMPCEVFLIFGIQWVMPKTVASLLFGWWNWPEKHSSNIWNMVPACLMWLTWWERNNCTFEDIARLIDLLKLILVGTLFQLGQNLGFYTMHFHF